MVGDFGMNDSLILVFMMFLKSFLTLIQHKNGYIIIIILLFFMCAAHLHGQNFQSA